MVKYKVDHINHFKTCERCGKDYKGSKYSKICEDCYKQVGTGKVIKSSKLKIYAVNNRDGRFQGFVNGFDKKDAKSRLRGTGFKVDCAIATGDLNKPSVYRRTK